MSTLRVRDLGLVPYQRAWRDMQAFTELRTADVADEMWCLEHPPVFTQGQAGKAEHVLAAGDIPVVQVDRGGQVTYHGPGQLVIYLLIDIRRQSIGVRQLVTAIEQSIITVLAELGIDAQARADAPGVYTAAGKIASLGLRVRKGCSFHGLSLNMAMDLEPFGRINPCGLIGQQVTQIRDLIEYWQEPVSDEAKRRLIDLLAKNLGYNTLLLEREYWKSHDA